MAVVAEAAGLPFRTYVSIDMGDTWPRIDNLGAIAKALGVPVSRLFRDKDSEPTPSEALEILRRLIESQPKTRHSPIGKEDPRIARIVDALTKNPGAISEVLAAISNYSD